MKAKKITSIVMIIICLIVGTENINGQNKPSSSEWNTDHLFPAKGKSTVHISTGIPFIGSAEYSYGFSNRLSAGLFFGKNPVPGIKAIGLRLRGIIFSSYNNLRMYAELPILLYPETEKSGMASWFIVYPNLMIEKRFESGVRLSAGAGLFGAGCVDDFFGLHTHCMTEEEHAVMNMKEGIFKDDEGVMAGIWCTLNTGIAFPIAYGIMLQQRLNVVMSSIEMGNIHKKEWFYDLPLIIQTELSFAL